MPANSNVATLSIRVPRLMREIIAEACDQTDMSRAEFIASGATDAATGIFSSGRSLKLLPEWFSNDERDRKMVTITMYPKDLELTKRAAKRMMIPHTRFILWAASLISMHILDKSVVQAITAGVADSLAVDGFAA